MKHVSVLLHETVDLLEVKPDGIYVDGTLGRGGHVGYLISKLQSGHLYAFDKDEQALRESRENLKDHLDHITMIHGDFRSMKQQLLQYGIEKVDGIMMDLGVSSPQFDDPSRGFSYRFFASLDMRMDQRQSRTAADIVNGYDERELYRIIRDYGEDKFAKNIAKHIVAARAKAPIQTTGELT